MRGRPPVVGDVDHNIGKNRKTDTYIVDKSPSEAHNLSYFSNLTN
jgi:hypothetical protein